MSPYRDAGTGGAPLTPEEEAYFAQYEPSLAPPPAQPQVDEYSQYAAPAPQAAPATPAYYPESQGGAPAPPPPQSMSAPALAPYTSDASYDPNYGAPAPAPSSTAPAPAPTLGSGGGSVAPPLSPSGYDSVEANRASMPPITGPATLQSSPYQTTGTRSVQQTNAVADARNRDQVARNNARVAGFNFPASGPAQGGQGQGSLLAQFYDDAATHARNMKTPPKKPTKAMLEAMTNPAPPQPYNPSDPFQAINTAFLPTPTQQQSSQPLWAPPNLPTPQQPHTNYQSNVPDWRLQPPPSAAHSAPPPIMAPYDIPSGNQSVNQELNYEGQKQEILNQPAFSLPQSMGINWDALKGVAGGRDTNFEQQARFAGAPTPHSPAMDRALSAPTFFSPTAFGGASTRTQPPISPTALGGPSSQTTTPPARQKSAPVDLAAASRLGLGSAFNDAYARGYIDPSGKLTEKFLTGATKYGLIDPATGLWTDQAARGGLIDPKWVGTPPGVTDLRPVHPLSADEKAAAKAGTLDLSGAGSAITDPNATLPVTPADVIAVESGSSGGGSGGGNDKGYYDSNGNWVWYNDYSSKGSSGGGGYSSHRSYGGGGGYSGGGSSGGRSYGSGKSGGGGFDFGSNETGGDWHDLLKDFDGNGTIDAKDEKKAKALFAKTRRGKRGGVGRGKGMSNLPATTPSAQRTKVLGNLSTAFGRPVGSYPEGM